MTENRNTNDSRETSPHDGNWAGGRSLGGWIKITDTAAWALGALTLLLVLILIIGVVGYSCSRDTSSDKNPAVGKDKVVFGSVSVTAEDARKGALALSNKLNSFTQDDSDAGLVDMYDYRSKMHTGAKPYKLSGMTSKMNQEAFAAMDAMLTACASATGCDDVTVRLAYVTATEAKDSSVSRSLRANAEDYKTGMGCDLLLYTDEGVSQKLATNETVSSWLQQNAARYGFVVRYPNDKAELTGVAEYTEYYRYVGVPHATYMKEKGLCLEEYLTFLHSYTSKDRLTVQGLDGKTYEVYYCAVTGAGSISCPTNYQYTMSGTNEGGVVVTIDRTAVSGQPADTGAAGTPTTLEPATAAPVTNTETDTDSKSAS